jgi:hypothetical protein
MSMTNNNNNILCLEMLNTRVRRVNTQCEKRKLSLFAISHRSSPDSWTTNSRGREEKKFSSSFLSQTRMTFFTHFNANRSPIQFNL